MNDKEAAEVRKGPKDPAAPVMAPHDFFYWNVHLDGLEYTHDLIVEREGVFKEAVLGMRWPRPWATRSPRTPRSTRKPTWPRSRACSIS